MKLIKSLILSLAVLVGFSSVSNARDVTLSMWTHNQLYVDYFNTYLEEVQVLLLIFKLRPIWLQTV